jgi:hypothetical protein
MVLLLIEQAQAATLLLLLRVRSKYQLGAFALAMPLQTPPALVTMGFDVKLDMELCRASGRHCTLLRTLFAAL